MENEQTQQEQTINGMVNDKAVANIDIQGPPFECPECRAQGAIMQFKSRPAVGVHRRVTHGYKSEASAYSQTYYQRKKAERLATGAQRRTYKTKATEEQTHEPVEHSTDEAQLSHHIAFAAGYITCFIETYAKGNGLSGDEFARRLAIVLHAKSR